MDGLPIHKFFQLIKSMEDTSNNFLKAKYRKYHVKMYNTNQMNGYTVN